MRAAFLVIAATLLSCGGGLGFAQTPQSGPPGPATPAPEGWTIGTEGPEHEASATKCSAQSDGFNPVRLTGAAAPDILGTCLYEDALGTGNAGVRVRRYVSGSGETQEAVDNDRALMEPGPGDSAPLFTARIEPFPASEGKRGARVTITKVRNGLLIDCFADDADFGAATAKIAGVCKN